MARSLDDLAAHLTATAALLIATALAGCGDDGGGDACVTGAADDGTYTLALDGLSLRGVTAHARAVAGATWDVAATIATTDVDGGVVVTLAAPGDVLGVALELPGVPADRMLQQGYQSWSFVGTVEIPAAVTLAADGLPAWPVPASGDPVDEELGAGYHAALFRRGTDGPALVVGALRADVAVTGLAAVRAGDGADVTVAWGAAREPLTGAGGEVRSEPILVAAAATPEAAMDRLAAAFAAEHAAEPAPARPPAGWFSWNEHFPDIDAALIEAHVDAVATTLAPLGMPLVEIDDGWEPAWGDWVADEARFPGGMEAIGATITDRGLVAGVWLAPFLVDTTAAAAQGDPTRFVRGPDGQPLVHRLTGNPRSFYVVDATDPDGLAIATAPIATLAAAGFTYFKLDFLYAGAFAGDRADAVTGVEALRRGLAAIRDAAGPDAVIEACGAPILPVIGRADVLRIGSDTAFEAFDLKFTMVGWAARALAGRAWLWPRIWLDADQVQVRAPYTLAEARAGAVVTALAGPAYSLGDDLTTLPAERLALALDPVALDVAGGPAPARAIGIMDTATREAPQSPLLEQFREPVGLVTLPASRFEVEGASGDHYAITVDWNGDHAVTVDTVQP